MEIPITWTVVVNYLLAMVERGSDQARDAAKEEIRRMAKVADKHAAAHSTEKENRP